MASTDWKEKNALRVALLALASCSTSEPPPAPPPRYAPPPVVLSASPQPQPPTAGRAAAAQRVVRLRVLGARWRGQLPADESGPWSLGEAHVVVENLNVSAAETGLSFVLESAAALDLADERYAQIPATRAEASAAMDAFVASGRISNEMLTVVVTSPHPKSWVSGWGQQGHTLKTPGKWPIILVNTRIAKSKQAHWIGHELGHVFGFYDTTFYEAAPVDNLPYTDCGLSLRSRTYPRDKAPAGARQNLMSYDTDERRSYFSAGYEVTHRQILDCWIRSSGL
jgi:hypothetical protein